MRHVIPLLSTHFALGCLQSLCEFNVPLLYGILAHVVQYFVYCKDISVQWT